MKRGWTSSARQREGYRKTLLQYLIGAYKKYGEGLFTRACNSRTMVDGFKL